MVLIIDFDTIVAHIRKRSDAKNPTWQKMIGYCHVASNIIG
jgi:hypothetical protein